VSDAADRPYNAILLIGFGGPEAPDEIRPFLDRVLKGRPVPLERYEEVVHHYDVLGGRSPYNELTRQLADDLRLALRREREMPVLIGLRNAAPGIDEAIAALARNGSRGVLGFILSAFRCEASWERYQSEVAQACEAIGSSAPTMIYPAPWHHDPRFIVAIADRVRDAMARIGAPDRAAAELIFTAHSIPVAMDGRETYVRQLHESAALVARAVDRENWRLAFQSRSGSPRDRWLEPDIREAIVANAKPKIVIPIGFLCDHVEVLYDLDIEAAAVAKTAGITLARAATVGSHPRFIEMMAELAATGRRDSSSPSSSE
jgi:ferrochelatase